MNKKKAKSKWLETLLNYRKKFHNGRDIVLQKKYKAKCCFCGLNFEAKPSSFMFRYVLNYGEIECANCGKRIGLKIDEKNKKMICFKLDTKNINKIARMPAACFQTTEKQNQNIKEDKKKYQ